MPSLTSTFRSSRLRALALGLAVALPSAALGAGGDTLVSFVGGLFRAEPTAFSSSSSSEGLRSRSGPAERKELPREAEALRSALDSELPPARAAELVARLGILGDARDVERLLTLTEHPNVFLRATAIQGLGRLGTPRAIDRLVTMAGSNDFPRAATEALGLSTAPEAVAALEQLATHPDPVRRHPALEALAMQGGPRARRIVHEAFARAGAADAWVLAGALATLGGEPDGQLLARVATQARDPRAPAALYGLAALPGPRSTALLLDTARKAIGARRDTALSLLAEIPDPEAVEILLEAWNDAPRTRGTVLNALANSRAPGALDALLTIVDEVPPAHAFAFADGLASRPELTAREVLRSLAAETGALATASLSALSDKADPKIIDLLVAQLDEGGRLPPAETLTYLATQGGDIGWELIEEVLAEGSANERRGVVWALQSRGDEDAAGRLLNLVRTEGSWTSAEAMSALETMGGSAQDSLRDLLLERLEDGHGTDMDGTLASLGRLGGEGVHEALSHRIERGTSSEKWTAITALGTLEDPEATATLQALLDDEDPTTRGAALSALAWQGDNPLSSETLDKVLSDKDPSVRAAAFAVLANQGTPEAVERLVDLSSAEDPHTRREALSALAHRGGEDAEKALLAALDDPEVAASALWAIDGLGSASGALTIRDLAQNGEPSIQIQALSMLSNDPSREATEILRSNLSLEDPDRAGAAVMALQSRGNSEAAEALAEFFDSIDPDEADHLNVRRQAASALQSIGGPLAVERKEALDGSFEQSFEEMGSSGSGGLGMRGTGVGG